MKSRCGILKGLCVGFLLAVHVNFVHCKSSSFSPSREGLGVSDCPRKGSEKFTFEVSTTSTETIMF